MYIEELVEDGIVTDVKDGLAVVSVIESTLCDDCSAKVFCNSENNIKSVTAKDSYGVKPGDNVRISIKGRNVVIASIILYGLPLLILVAGIILGMNFIRENSEIFSAAIGLSFLGIYLLSIYLILNSKRLKNRFLPKIVFVRTKK